MNLKMKSVINYSILLYSLLLCMLGTNQSNIAFADLQRPNNGGPWESKAYLQLNAIKVDGTTSENIGQYIEDLIKKKTSWTKEELVIILDGGWINPSCQVERVGEGQVGSKEAYMNWITELANNASRRNKLGIWVRVNYVVEPSLVRSLFDCADTNVMKDSFHQLAHALFALNNAQNSAAYLPLPKEYFELRAVNSANHTGLSSFLQEWFAYYTDFKDFQPGSPAKLAAGLFTALEHHGNRLVGIVPNPGNPSMFTRTSDQLACEYFRLQAPWNANTIRCLVHGNYWGIVYYSELFERYDSQIKSAERNKNRKQQKKKKKKKKRR